MVAAVGVAAVVGVAVVGVDVSSSYIYISLSAYTCNTNEKSNDLVRAVSIVVGLAYVHAVTAASRGTTDMQLLIRPSQS